MTQQNERLVELTWAKIFGNLSFAAQATVKPGTLDSIVKVGSRLQYDGVSELSMSIDNSFITSFYLQELLLKDQSHSIRAALNGEFKPGEGVKFGVGLHFESE